jgi:hypothetical protein
VLTDPALEQRLQAIPDWPSFVEEAVRVAAERDVVLSAAGLHAARDEARRSWLERWV